ncbi:hypothetical protein R1sor_001534 [Riccia sorocarpa]|uniref:Nucleotide-diphospho-sugar transferase domain-containing protein n=1 Tax=Riccia sorocarpa TaxID=122646 RepID=A0ABD3GZC4_9MARC
MLSVTTFFHALLTRRSRQRSEGYGIGNILGHINCITKSSGSAGINVPGSASGVTGISEKTSSAPSAEETKSYSSDSSPSCDIASCSLCSNSSASRCKHSTKIYSASSITSLIVSRLSFLQFFMSGDFLKMMWRKIYFLRVVLEAGYNLISCDADMLWFRDPLARLSPDPEIDFQISGDRFNGNKTGLGNDLNTGFFYVRSNNVTINFFKFWYDSRLEYPNKNEQNVLDAIKTMEAFAQLQLKAEALDTLYFSGFCQTSRDFEKVCTMHANCCTTQQRKLIDLKWTKDD